MAKHKSAKRKASRKSSSDTSEKSVPSPVEKKLRNEQTEEGEDEVLTEFNMAEGLKDRLDQVLARRSVLEKKLDKLEAIEVEIQEVNAKVSKLESKVNNLQGEITQLRGKHDEIDKCARKLESDVAFMNGTVEKMEAELNGLKALHNLDINLLNQKLLYSETHSRRENLKSVSTIGPGRR